MSALIVMVILAALIVISLKVEARKAETKRLKEEANREMFKIMIDVMFGVERNVKVVDGKEVLIIDGVPRPIIKMK